MRTCHLCTKTLELGVRYHKGYQGQDWTSDEYEDHAIPDDCIRYLVKQLAKLTIGGNIKE